jgi:hypothetical protein
MSRFPSFQSFQSSSANLLNNRNTSRYFNNINEKSVYKKYTNTKSNSNKCTKNSNCTNKNKLTKSKAKLGLQTLSYGYRKKIKNSLTNMIGLIKGTITKKEIVEIANALDILNKVYNDSMCESGITMDTESKNNTYSRSRLNNRKYKSIDIYSYLIKQMKDKLPTIPTETLSLFINNIKNSNKTSTNSKSKTDSDYEYLMNNNNFKSVFKSVLEKIPVCKTS